MKHIFLIAALLLLAAPVQAEEQAASQIVIAKTSSDQRALTEILSARINSSLQGERYSLDRQTRDDSRDVSISR